MTNAMRAAVALGLLVATAPVAGVQETPPGAVVTPVFEVASVRPKASSNTGYSTRWLPDGRFQATNITVRRLIDVAYDLRTPHQVTDAPGWIASERFDIEAHPVVPVPRTPERLIMLQGLLRDRFGLVMREQLVDVPVYELVRTQPDAPLPRTIRESTVTCTVVRWDPLTEQPPTRASDCGVGLVGAGRIVSTGAQIPSLIAALGPLVDRRILDRTGLTGRYDFELTWSPDPLAGSDRALANVGIFSAIQEVGLMLQPAFSTERGYVIERIQRPTPD